MSRMICDGMIDIEVYDTKTDSWAQGRYLAHGFDDILWTNDIDEALAFLKAQVVSYEGE